MRLGKNQIATLELIKEPGSSIVPGPLNQTRMMVRKGYCKTNPDGSVSITREGRDALAEALSDKTESKG